MPLTDAVSRATPDEVARVQAIARDLSMTSFADRLMHLDRFLRRLGAGGEHGNAPLVGLLTLREAGRALALERRRNEKLSRELRSYATQEKQRIERARRKKGLR